MNQKHRQRSSRSAGGAISINRFGLQLLKKLEAEQPGRNLFFSPCSLAFCLALASNGAAGSTREELTSVLGVKGVAERELNLCFRELREAVEQPGPQLQLNLASAVWGIGSAVFAADFVQRIREFYDADAHTLEAEGATAAAVINRWVSSKTSGRITTLVNPDDLRSAASCVLTNAMYCKGPWSAPFDPRATRDRPFSLLDGRHRDVPMMSRSARYPYLETKEFQAIALDYAGAGDSLAMYVFLPREGTTLETSGWEQWLPRFRTAQVELALPRFSVTCALDLVPSLSKLGLGAVFQPGADFSRMGLAGSFISAIKHKARVDVSEEGTEAAASSAVVMGRSLIRPTSMIVDRPFFLAILDRRTGLLLFLGNFVDP